MQGDGFDTSLLYLGKPERSSGEHDALLGERTIAGPFSGKDVRMFFDVATLRRVLAAAEASSVRRARLDGVGIRIRAWRAPNGDLYETWQIVSAAPKPERHAFFDGRR